VGALFTADAGLGQGKIKPRLYEGGPYMGARPGAMGFTPSLAMKERQPSRAEKEQRPDRQAHEYAHEQNRPGGALNAA